MERNQEPSQMTAFVCANCARPGSKPSSLNRAKPAIPDFGWLGQVRQVLVPCTGRLQPEHVLRAFESGSSIVSVVACSEENCHHIEGSRRCARRVDYIRSILKEIGLGDERLLLFHLSGSAAEDLAVVAGKLATSCSPDLAAEVAKIRDKAMHALLYQPRNPLALWPADLDGPGGDGTEEEEDEPIC